MFAETSCVNIFPIPIWAHALKPEDAQRVNRAALDLVETIRAETPGLKPREHWQTANNLQTRPELQDLMGLVAEATTGVLQRLKLEYGSFLVTGCWANIMPGGGLPHRSHTHPNNFLSGVYYVQVPSGGDSIVFQDPKSQNNIIAPRVLQPNEHNSRNATFPVRAGALILFPAWLPHSVESHQSEQERISISFNVMFQQFGEEMAQPKWEYRPGSQPTTAS